MAPTFKDPDWIPLTPEAKTASTRRKQLRGKSGTLVQEKGISNSSVRIKAKKICESSKRKPRSSNKLCSFNAHQMPQILKRKRVTRKRMSLNKLVVLARLANELGKFECSGLDLSWLHMKRERSNTAIRRTNFSSTFAVHVRVQNECFQNMDLEQNMKEEDSLVDAGAEKMNCNGGDNTLRHPPLKVYQRRKNRGCPNTGHAILDQRDCNEDVGDSDDLSSSSLTASSARSMSGENGCDAAHDLSILETQQVIAARSMNEEFGCDAANTMVIVETQQVIADESMAGKIDEFNNSNGVEQDTNPGNEANVMTENVDAWVPLTPPIRAKHADSKKNSGSFETVHSSSANNADGFMSNRIASESSIDILKKRNAHGVDIEDKKPHKRRKMKRYNPKVIDPGKPVKPSTPKPRTPKPAQKVKNKKVDDPVMNVNGEATCKSRKKSCKRKLDFDRECRTMDHEELPQDRTCSQLEVGFKIPKICKVQEESVQEVVVRKKSVKHREKCGNSTDETKIQDNVLLIQDEAFRQAVEDFLTEKMESLSIEDIRSNSSGAVVLSKEKIKDPNKEHKPSVDIDPMTMIIWDLLMEGNWSEAAEAEAIGNDDYMKGQRNLFRGRFERLVQSMHLVQGNRNFSPWKGSILDSIIGVFLTQNVSDHLSSSAFMALRARYPPLSLSEQSAKYCCDDDQRVTEPSNRASEEPNPVSRVEQPVENGNESHSEAPDAAPKGKKQRLGKKKPIIIDWEPFRKQYSHGMSRERTVDNADSMNYEAIRQASADEIAAVIKQRGMNNQLARRIKRFLDRLMRDHGSLDLEWLRYAPPLKVKEFLESVSGLGLKSTECVRLLALRFCAFPVDTNAGRFFVRVGWVPLRPLPEDVQLHLLEQYPILDSIQKYLWPRICDLDHSQLYQGHCHSVTIAKSFCTKKKPNCTQCPMKGECRHYASEFASAKPRLEGPQPKSSGESSSQEAPMLTNLDGDESRRNQCSSSDSGPIIEFPPSPVAERASVAGNSGPTIEFPPSPVPDEPFDIDIEDMGREPEITTFKLSGQEFSNEIIPCIKLSGREFSKEFHSLVGKNEQLSKALVAISPQAGSTPMPKPSIPLRLRTVHLVYELPDSHPLLAKFDKREPEDPSPYLLALWKADEPNEEEDTSCDEGSPCSSREVALCHQHQAIKGTILIPCRTANRGAFPLNGTYFQINEVFADHESSRRPIDVPRDWLRHLETRFLYCGTSITSICRGMQKDEVAYCFTQSSICTRGFDTKSGAAKSLARRFHLCKSRENSKNKENSKKVK